MRLWRYLLTFFTIGLSAWPVAVRAQVYGSGTYSSSDYGATTIHVGPVILPLTGQNIFLLIAGAVLIAAGIVTFFVVRDRRRKQRLQTPSPPSA